MPRSPYRIARQEHLGDMLDRLQGLGLLTWKWDYEVRKGRESGSAVYWVTEPGRRRRKLDTKRAEELAVGLCQQENIVWLPVPYPGGETHRAETLRKIEELQQGIQPTETSTATQVHPIKPLPFDLATYPELQRRLHDEPSRDRSAQTFRVACRCIEIGLRDGQIKWFLAQYPPLLDKYRGRTGADRELDRVITKAREDTSDTR